MNKRIGEEENQLVSRYNAVIFPGRHVMPGLPTPSAETLARSKVLTQDIVTHIQEKGGWIPFSDYMALALYTPGLGYYSSGQMPFGERGDFTTAPELTPLFAQAFSRQLAALIRDGLENILEVGAGSGTLAADILRSLEAREALPERYAILEISGTLRARQAETLQNRVPHLMDRVVWWDTLPETFAGIVIGNEVLDAMPVERIVWTGECWQQRGVMTGEDLRLQWSDRPLPEPLLIASEALPVEKSSDHVYLTELHKAARAWIATWGHILERGVILLTDYGYPQATYYQAQRSEGMLKCFYRHQIHSDPLLWPGLCDITSAIDFTAIAEAGYQSGLAVLGYTTQAQFLLNCGVLEDLAVLGDAQNVTYLQAARLVHKLLAPQEMGELFKVLAFGKSYESPLLGFIQGDRTHTL